MTKEDQVLHRLPIPTEEGEFTAWYSMSGLAGLSFPGKAKAQNGSPKEVPPRARIWHCATRKALSLALAGKPVRNLPPLDMSSGTDFQQSVWRVLEGIALGDTMSYAEVAKAVGKPRSSRAVGQACGANPVPVLVPCHRVLASNDKIGGFSGGAQWKRRLLTREGVQV